MGGGEAVYSVTDGASNYVLPTKNHERVLLISKFLVSCNGAKCAMFLLSVLP